MAIRKELLDELLAGYQEPECLLQCADVTTLDPQALSA